MKKLLPGLLFLVFLIPVRAGNLTVSVITVDPGKDVYSVFGHTAIRIINNFTATDRVYNFGTFDFDDPFFYLKFIRGNLNYFLSVVPYNDFIYSVETEQRTAREQVLNLSDQEATLLKQQLEHCYQSDERYYRYDFFYDNCATRVRDYLEKFSLVSDSTGFCCSSLRDLLIPYIKEKYWLNLGINLALGKNADKQASPADYMFLPDYIYKSLQQSRSVRDEKVMLTVIPHNENRKMASLWPWIITGIILAMMLTRLSRRILFYILFGGVSITGLILLTVNILTVNQALKANWNLLWLLPALPVLVTERHRVGKYLRLGYLVLLMMFLIFINHLPQEFSTTLLPWILGIMLVLAKEPFELWNHYFAVNRKMVS
ncbi:MAG TPA: DUF4105 domain-containing protein [Bacteroidales bacterium]|nr:DUF4105 domain-containing protein [Bacteroidales bacterium]